MLKSHNWFKPMICLCQNRHSFYPIMLAHWIGIYIKKMSWYITCEVDIKNMGWYCPSEDITIPSPTLWHEPQGCWEPGPGVPRQPICLGLYLRSYKYNSLGALLTRRLILNSFSILQLVHKICVCPVCFEVLLSTLSMKKHI